MRPWREGQAGMWSACPEGIGRSMDASRPLGTEAGVAERQVYGTESGWAAREAQTGPLWK